MNLQPPLLANAMAKLKPSPLALRHRPLPSRSSVLLPPSRSAASTHRGQQADRPIDKPLGIQARKIIPSDNKDFMDFQTGVLRTTPEVRDFLSRTGISHDCGIMYRLRDPVVSTLSRNFDAMIYYSPEYVIHPYHVNKLTPRCHPGAREMCSRYEIMLKEMSLWIHTSCFGADKAIVRGQIKRRIKALVHVALRSLGYDGHGWAESKRIKGTLGLHIHRPLSGIDEDAQEFATAIVLAVERESRRIHGNGVEGVWKGVKSF